ncbi:MAG: hypothetical protein HN929_07675 [Chloroflexi bacterium]|jgi:hypothetical protein|nr:hypothetical protein [Chloroflexota bacterium]MBT7081328.1 hypothetical protein [Chloroflexota bacterium]MBT7290827.1 hypothetical protein [Chloroflexota bacterium]
MPDKIGFQGNCQTTAMGIMPHKDVGQALELCLSLDIPYWPQLPNFSYYEDMYAQISEHFPGVSIDTKGEKVNFSFSQFEQQLEDYSARMDNPATYELSEDYSAVYHKFLALNLAGYSAIRGQVTGPVSFGFRVVDENSKPIIYRDDVRDLLFDFIKGKVNVQYDQLVKKNPNAFVWFDEPGLGWVFSGMSGYNDVEAKKDYHNFLDGIKGPKALHLCANVNLPYLLSMGIDILSFDAFQIMVMPKGYAQAVADFMKDGGIIAWGIVPTDSTSLDQQSPDSVVKLLLNYWTVVADNADISIEQIARQSLLAPARCCLKNTGDVGSKSDQSKPAPKITDKTIEEDLVSRAFACLTSVSDILKKMFNI